METFSLELFEKYFLSPATQELHLSSRGGQLQSGPSEKLGCKHAVIQRVAGTA